MTVVPRRPWRIYIDHAFESSLATAILLIAIASLISGTNPSGRLEGTLDTILYATWRWGIFLSAIGVLLTLALRPWAARRRPSSRREASLAYLRVYESAACMGLGTSCLVYSVTIVWDGLDNALFVAGAMAAFAWGFLVRAAGLRAKNKERLQELQVVNSFDD